MTKYRNLNKIEFREMSIKKSVCLILIKTVQYYNALKGFIVFINF